MSGGGRTWLWRLRVILGKEVRDHLRDRRSLLLALIYPLLGPMLLAGGLYAAGAGLEHKGRRVVEVPAVGAENAPDLVAFLKEYDVHLRPAPDNPRQAVREGRVPLVILFPEEARDSRQFTVRVLEDLSRVSNMPVTAKVKGTINLFNIKRAKELTRAAGLAEEDLNPITIKGVSVARENNVALYFYELMPPLIIFMVFLGGVYLAIDATAGERERGSLEPLLIAPVERWELLLAKTGAAYLFTAVTTAINLAAFGGLLALAAAGNQELIPPPGPGMFVGAFLLSLPLMAVAVTLQMTVAAMTRSMKEAQIYLGLLPLVPALPGMIMVLSPMTPELWSVSVPVLGQLLLFHKLIGGETPGVVEVVACTATTLALAGLMFWRAAKLFRRENLFFLG